MLPRESLYIGIDVGKFRHIAGFLSRTLLVRHKQFEGCPTFAFEQSREGFRSFVDRIRSYVPLEQAVVLLEHTGHYHRLLEQYPGPARRTGSATGPNRGVAIFCGSFG